jgi:hypothetical protein
MSVPSHDITFDSRVQTWITVSYTLALATKVICLREFFLLDDTRY